MTEPTYAYCWLRCALSQPTQKGGMMLAPLRLSQPTKGRDDVGAAAL